MNIALEKITLEGMNELDRDFQRDPATFADMSLFSAYRYSPEETRKRFERYGAPTGGISSFGSTGVRWARPASSISTGKSGRASFPSISRTTR